MKKWNIVIIVTSIVALGFMLIGDAPDELGIGDKAPGTTLEMIGISNEN